MTCTASACVHSGKAASSEGCRAVGAVLIHPWVVTPVTTAGESWGGGGAERFRRVNPQTQALNVGYTSDNIQTTLWQRLLAPSVCVRQ